jgi:hypothetical protein
VALFAIKTARGDCNDKHTESWCVDAHHMIGAKSVQRQQAMQATSSLSVRLRLRMCARVGMRRSKAVGRRPHLDDVARAEVVPAKEHDHPLPAVKNCHLRLICLHGK